MYAEGYSGGGETMSRVMGLRPDLFTAYLLGALLSPCVRAKKKQETVQRFPALWCFQWEAGIQLFFSYDLRFHKL